MLRRRGGPTAAAPTKPEFPSDAIQEALVNAVCHRDYTSNACVQVMLFRDRLEIINPGSLPKGTTKEDLYRVHDSNPRNEVIALAMSWTSYVEKPGSGTKSSGRLKWPSQRGRVKALGQGTKSALSRH